MGIHRSSPYGTIEPAISTFKTYGKGGLFFLYPAAFVRFPLRFSIILMNHDLISAHYSNIARLIAVKYANKASKNISEKSDARQKQVKKYIL